MTTTRTFTARVHHEDRSYWAEVLELPGCFASGDTLDELREALSESIELYLTDLQDDEGTTFVSVEKFGGIEIDEFKLAVRH